jgi:hypothetical protein
MEMKLRFAGFENFLEDELVKDIPIMKPGSSVLQGKIHGKENEAVLAEKVQPKKMEMVSAEKELPKKMEKVSITKQNEFSEEEIIIFIKRHL